MRFDILKDGKKVSFGNPNMLDTYTDEEIKEVYKKWGYEVEIKKEP